VIHVYGVCSLASIRLCVRYALTIKIRHTTAVPVSTGNFEPRPTVVTETSRLFDRHLRRRSVGSYFGISFFSNRPNPARSVVAPTNGTVDNAPGQYRFNGRFVADHNSNAAISGRVSVVIWPLAVRFQSAGLRIAPSEGIRLNSRKHAINQNANTYTHTYKSALVIPIGECTRRVPFVLRTTFIFVEVVSRRCRATDTYVGCTALMDAFRQLGAPECDGESGRTSTRIETRVARSANCASIFRIPRELPYGVYGDDPVR